MLDLDIETVVPGHGPITDKTGVAAVKGYLEYIAAEARKRYDAGMSIAEAAADISLESYSSWSDSERIAVNVGSLYREFAAEKGDAAARPAGEGELFALMAQMANRKPH
jgi:hypothetical protein